MSLRPLRRPLLGRRWLATIPVVAVGMLAASSSPALAASCSTAGTGAVADFCSQPANTQAGGDPTITSTVDFNYTGSDTVKDLTVALAPGLMAEPKNVPATCTSAQLSSNSCPAGAVIGSGSATLTGVSQPATAAIYLMPAPTSNDVSGIGIVLSVGGSPVATITGTADVVANSSGQPVIQLSFKNLPNSAQLTSLTLAFNGTTSSGAAFTRLPTNSSTATTTLSADTYAGASGTGSDSFTPTGASSLPYAPKLTAAAVKDSGDTGVKVSTLITQAANEAADKTVTLTVPSGTLSPNPTAITEVGQQVGEAQAVTPLLSSPLNGTVTLTGSGFNLGLTISFPAPTPLTLVGTINLGTNSVTFNNVPDVPLTSLAVVINGGPKALFITGCSPSSGTLTGTFTGQNGANYTSPSPFSVSGCSSSAPPTAKAPTIGAGSLTGAAGGHPQLSFSLAAGKGAAKLSSFTLSLPRGLSFISKGLKKGVSIAGAKVRSVKLSHGKLVVTLKAPAATLKVKITSKALKISSSLRKQIKKHKVKSLKSAVTVKDASGKATVLALKITRLH